MKFEVDGKIFDSEEEAVQFCAENEIPTASIVVFEDGEEETSIEENPEETPSKTECITEEELVQKANARTLLENIDEIEDETDKTAVIQKALNLTQDKREKTSVKYFEPKETTETYIKNRYQKLIDRLSDVDSKVCPICNREWSTLSKDTEDLTQHKELEGRFPMIRIQHIKSKHPSIWKFIKDLFKISEGSQLPHHGKYWSSNPESCSEEETELSREELTSEIISNPKLRKLLFERWIQKKKKRE